MAETYRLGRDVGRGPLRPSCTLRYDDGAITFEAVDDDHGPSTSERRQILAHFAAPVTALKPVEDGKRDMLVPVEHQPGTAEHFRHAANQIPKPFGRMPTGGKR